MTLSTEAISTPGGSPLMPADDLLTPAQAGKKLGVSHDTVDRLIAAGRLSFVNVGTSKRRRARIRESDLERFITENHYDAPVPGA